MRELRRDPVIGRWVIIATDRAKRPSDFAVKTAKPAPAKVKDCPFCEGNESMTPPEIFAIRESGKKPNTPDWTIRVVPSISGFLSPKGDIDRHGTGIYDLMNGVGAHEIVIMTPYHGLGSDDFANLRPENIVEVVAQRMKELRKDARFKHALIFQNHGSVAGGSKLGHFHIQIIATPSTPKRVKEELTGARRYYEYKDRCIFCDMIKQEITEDKRVISRKDGFLAINPFCSRFPFETWILPEKHSADFDALEKAGMEGLGSIIREVFFRMNKTLGDFPFNAILHTSPFRRGRKKGYWDTIENDFHWHIEIMPRLTKIAGFEWGSGFYINSLPPEEACKFLKEVSL